MQTRLTDRFSLACPVISAPMAIAAGGKLAAAVSSAGGLGLIGGGYGDAEWLIKQFEAARGEAVGCGFITWSLAEQPQLLDLALEHTPSAIFLSFGDPEPFAQRVKNAGVPLICQIQTRADAEHAIAVGADVIVAQGAEAGGHGEKRATMTIVPEVADLISARAPEMLLCAAGGIADGRGLAAALMLGADGVVMGSRLWASKEALVHRNMHADALSATGDETIRSRVMDIARLLDWPERYTARVLNNSFTEQWHGKEDLLRDHAHIEAARWRKAWVAGDTTIANTFVGEAAGLIDRIEPAGEIVKRIVNEAQALLRGQDNNKWKTHAHGVHVHDPVTEHLGVRYKLSDQGGCIATLDCGPEHCNIFGIVHGAILFAMADVGMGKVLRAALDDDRQVASIGINALYLQAVHCGMVTVESKLIRLGKTIAVLESRAHADGGDVCAMFSGNFHISSKPSDSGT